MKTIQQKFKTLLILIMFGFAFTSCSSDDSVANQAPNSFNLIEVADGATNVDLQPQLSWEAATDPDGDSVTYQVYFDSQNPPQTSIANNLEVSSLNLIDELQPETIYYWQVVAKDSNGNSTESSVASFTSRDMNNAEAIIGKWFYESETGQPPYSECRKKSFLEFAEGLFLEHKGYTEDSNGNCLSSTRIFSYEVDGNDQIEVTDDNGTYTWSILFLTETNLVLNILGGELTLSK